MRVVNLPRDAGVTFSGPFPLRLPRAFLVSGSPAPVRASANEPTMSCRTAGTPQGLDAPANEGCPPLPHRACRPRRPRPPSSPSPLASPGQWELNVPSKQRRPEWIQADDEVVRAQSQKAPRQAALVAVGLPAGDDPGQVEQRMEGKERRGDHGIPNEPDECGTRIGVGEDVAGQHFAVLRFFPIVPRCWILRMESAAAGTVHAVSPRSAVTGPMASAVWMAVSVRGAT